MQTIRTPTNGVNPRQYLRIAPPDSDPLHSYRLGRAHMLWVVIDRIGPRQAARYGLVDEAWAVGLWVDREAPR